MSASIQPDAFAKYAPRWIREGTKRPRNTTTLQPDAQLSTEVSNEPPWRGPSPFRGDLRRWRAGAPSEAQVDDDIDEQHASSHQVVVINTTMHLPGTSTGKLWKTAALLSMVAVPLGAAALILFPIAGYDSRSSVASASSATEAMSPREDYAVKSVSVVAKSSPAAVSQRTPDNGAAAARTTPDVAKAMYVVASLDPAPASQPQADSTAPVAMPQEAQVPSPQAQPHPAAVPAGASPATQNVLAQNLSQDEMDRLIKRGESFMAQGDVLAARAFLLRAAEGGDARAALALGSTYDPNVLKGMGVFGIRPDTEQAHMWYARAAEYGSQEASQRITALAQLGR